MRTAFAQLAQGWAARAHEGVNIGGSTANCYMFDTALKNIVGTLTRCGDRGVCQRHSGLRDDLKKRWLHLNAVTWPIGVALSCLFSLIQNRPTIRSLREKWAIDPMNYRNRAKR